MRRMRTPCACRLDPTTQIVDIAYTHLDGATPLETGSRIRMLFGSSEALGKVYRIDGDTALFEEEDRGFLQIRLDSPHLLCKDDRCIIRRESPLETLGGGIILDPYAPKVRQRNRSEQTKYLTEVCAGNYTALLQRMGLQGRSSLEYGLLDCKDGIQLGNFWYAASTVDNFLQLLIEHIQVWHANHPLKVGATRMEIAPRFPFLDKDALQTLCTLAIDTGRLNLLGGRIHMPDFTVQLSEQDQQALNSRLQMLKQKGLEGIASGEFKGMSKPLLQYALETAHIIRVSNQMLHPTFMNHLLLQLRRHFEHHTTLSTSEFKEISQLSRKFSIPLLEWLDENHKTRRNGDVRISGGMLSEDV